MFGSLLVQLVACLLGGGLQAVSEIRNSISQRNEACLQLQAIGLACGPLARPPRSIKVPDAGGYRELFPRTGRLARSRRWISAQGHGAMEYRSTEFKCCNNLKGTSIRVIRRLGSDWRDHGEISRRWVTARPPDAGRGGGSGRPRRRTAGAAA